MRRAQDPPVFSPQTLRFCCAPLVLADWPISYGRPRMRTHALSHVQAFILHCNYSSSVLILIGYTLVGGWLLVLCCQPNLAHQNTLRRNVQHKLFYLLRDCTNYHVKSRDCLLISYVQLVYRKDVKRTYVFMYLFSVGKLRNLCSHAASSFRRNCVPCAWM